MTFPAVHSRRLLLLFPLLCMTLWTMGEDSIPVAYATTSTRDTLCAGDTVWVIHTVCAPACSSCVRVYDKEWRYVRTLTPPFRSPFPEAFIENGQLRWRDNYPQLLDDSEKRLRSPLPHDTVTLH